jgi:predicted TIM-barrel fold metal-dependent hydrolase
VLAEVIEARNERGRDYPSYIRALFADANIAEVLIDTGYADGLDAQGIDVFTDTIAPTKAHYLARVETITDDLFAEDLSYEDLKAQFVFRVTDALDGAGNFGHSSVGMKSYLLPDIGLIRPHDDDAAAEASWEKFKGSRHTTFTDRVVFLERGKVLRERLLALALEECLERDMPMQFHAGDGEPPDVILRNQHPYYLEEVVRFEKDGVLRMPKVIPIHAGYPLVGQAAWLSHIYRNVYFELSMMTPFIHHGLLHRYLQIMEAAPLSKILYGSDAFHMPELYWLAARWGKRYLAQALAVYVDAGVLGEEEALQAARMILHGNTRRAYNLTD